MVAEPKADRSSRLIAEPVPMRGALAASSQTPLMGLDKGA